MHDPHRTFFIQALDAIIEWRVPASAATWLSSDVFGPLVVDGAADVEPQQITWTHDGQGWRAAMQDDHVSGVSASDLLPESFIVVNRIAAESMADRRLVLHAGAFAVATGAGDRAVALCGASGSGKSTATAAAVLRGHAFVADEVCALDPELWTVRPYPRPIGLRPGGAAAIGVAIGGPLDDAGPPSRVWHAPTVVTDEVPLALVALVERRPGPTELEIVRPAEALELLVNQTLATDGRERLMFRRTEALSRAVTVARVGYEDVFEAVDVLADAVSSSAGTAR